METTFHQTIQGTKSILKPKRCTEQIPNDFKNIPYINDFECFANEGIAQQCEVNINVYINLPSCKLRYPFTKALLSRWFSFSQVGYVSFLEGT